MLSGLADRPADGSASNRAGDQSGSPARRWGGVKLSPFAIDSSSPTAGSFVVAGLTPRDNRDDSDRQVKHEVAHLKEKVHFVKKDLMEVRGLNTTVEFRLNKLLDGFEELRNTTEKRLNQLLDTLGAPNWAAGTAPDILVEELTSPMGARSGSRTPPRNPLLDGDADDPSARSPRSLEITSPNSYSVGMRGRIPLFERMRRLEQALDDSTLKLDSPSRRGLRGNSAIREATFPQRLAYIEKALGDSAEKRAQEQAEAAQGRSKLLQNWNSSSMFENAHAAPVTDRLTYVENVVGDSVEKHAREIAASHVKLDLFAVRVGHCEVAKDQIHGLRQAHSKSETDFGNFHSTIRQRLEYLEKLIGDSADHHAMEIAKIKADRLGSATHMHALSECRERVDTLEHAHMERSQKHTEDIEQLHGKHAKLFGDVIASSQNHAMMRKDIDRHGQNLDSHASSLRDRVQALEDKMDQLTKK